MSVTEILQFAGQTSPDTIQRAVQSLQGMKSLPNFVLSTGVQDKNTAQITTEWASRSEYEQSRTSAGATTFAESVHGIWGEPKATSTVAFNRSALGADGPATAHVVEYVQNYFPAARVTPEFRKQIEADFLKFDEIYIRGAVGTTGYVIGWGVDEQEHEDLKGEKARCFFVARGWESMGHFERSCQTDAFKESIPILFAWGVPHKMWHVERKA